MTDSHDNYDLVIERVRGLLELVIDARVDDMTTFIVSDAYTELAGWMLDPYESCDDGEFPGPLDGPVVIERVDARTALVLAVEELAHAMRLSRDVRECFCAGVTSAHLRKALETFPIDA